MNLFWFTETIYGSSATHLLRMESCHKPYEQNSMLNLNVKDLIFGLFRSY